MEKKHSLTPAFIISYFVLSEDTWRIGFGILFAYILAPSVLATRQVQDAEVIMIYLMLIAIGWGLFAYPARKITRTLMEMIRKRYK